MINNKTTKWFPLECVFYNFFCQLVDKAKSELLRVRKKSQRKKPTGKYEEKEKQVKGYVGEF